MAFHSEEEIDRLFQLQIERELQMNNLGKRDLDRSTTDSEERQYASHTIYGSWVRREYTLKISKVLKLRFERLKRGKAMEGAKALVLLKDHLHWDRVAYIALSTMLDYAGIPRKYGRMHSAERKDKGLITTSELYLMIAKRICIEANLQHLRKHFRHKYSDMKKEFFTEHASFAQKITRIKRHVRGLNRYYQSVASGETFNKHFSSDRAQELHNLFKWVEWDNATSLQVGSLLASIANQETGFFAYNSGFDENGKTRHIFCFSKVFDEFRDELQKQAEGFAFFLLPMLIPPKPWRKPKDPTDVQIDELGGYYAANKAFYPSIVRGYRKGTVISQKTIDFINSQQEHGFRLDKDIIEIQKHLADKGWTILGENDKDEDTQDSWRPYRHPEPWETPRLDEHLRTIKKPKEDASMEDKARYNEKKAALKQIAIWHTRQEELKQLAKPVTRYLRIVNIIENDRAFYFPWNLDWRGRCYPMVDGLNPQGPEYQKAALSFCDPTPVDSRTKYWLFVGLGSAAGFDKESFETRYDWAESNLGLIKAVGNDPLGDGFQLWTSMPEPWIFLRACLEYKRIFIEGQTYTDIACLGMDATQSGLQLLGGMVKDLETCDLVNCVPGYDKPRDAYGTVLAKAVELIKEDDGSFPVYKVEGKRKLVKTPVMTKVYAAGHNTRVGQIRRALLKEGIRLANSDEKNEEMIEYFTSKVEEAMNDVIPGVDAILKWFQTVVKTALERGKEDEDGVKDIKYETPSGNIVCVEYRDPITKPVQTETLGQTVCMPASKKDPKGFQCNAIIGKGETDLDDVIRSIAANFTHGCGDAALLHMALHDQKGACFASTHDCIYSPPSEVVDDNHQRIREAFIKLCNSNSLQRFAELNGCPDLPPPIVGTYDPRVVRYARYFFC